MAHAISLPVQFEFTSLRLKWVSARVSLNRWRRPRNKRYRDHWYIEASVLSPSEFESAVYGIWWPDLPDRIQQELPSPGVRFPAELRRVGMEILLYVPRNEEPRTMTIDPWKARDEFLSLRRSTTDLLAFLNKYGAWRRNLPWDSTTAGRGRPRIAFPAAFWNKQGEISEAMKKGAKNWAWGEMLAFRPRLEFPHYVHEDEGCFDAIKTAITIDFLRGVRFKICAREDCAKPFPADRTNKIYCEQYCAHLVSVRKKRAALRKERSKSGGQQK
jgi:hypothetical protein